MYKIRRKNPSNSPAFSLAQNLLGDVFIHQRNHFPRCFFERGLAHAEFIAVTTTTASVFGFLFMARKRLFR